MSDCDDCEKFKDNMPCYDDYRFCEKSLAEHDKKIRADAIEEYFKEFDKWIKSNPKLTYFWIEFQVQAKKIAEQLKDQKNEN